MQIQIVNFSEDTKKILSEYLLEEKLPINVGQVLKLEDKIIKLLASKRTALLKEIGKKIKKVKSTKANK